MLNRNDLQGLEQQAEILRKWIAEVDAFYQQSKDEEVLANLLELQERLGDIEDDLQYILDNFAE
jgi:hypothetical protein